MIHVNLISKCAVRGLTLLDMNCKQVKTANKLNQKGTLQIQLNVYI